MHKRTAIVWFRLDLRLHDNEAFTEALRSAEEIIPVYIFDERTFTGKTKNGFPKTGKFRAQFIIESVTDLRNSLRKLGSDLYIRVGKPEEEIFEIARKVKSSWVFCNRERMEEELFVQDALEQNLWSIGQELRYSRGKLLYYTADLPFPVTHTPNLFSQFRKEVERYVPIREPLPVPERIPPVTIALAPGEIPTLEDFGLGNFENDERADFHFKGGEKVALKHLQNYLWESGLVEKYKPSKPERLIDARSSRFSAWLAQGCLSPKMVYKELKRYEADYGKSKSTYELFLDLLWRDYFRFMGKKHGSKIFQKEGIFGQPDPNWKDDFQLLKQWIDGETGVPFIDAHMRELAKTGYISNRGRQNVASYLVKDLSVNWLLGAEYFESQLIDYDVCSNYCNWGYLAGVGSDPKESRHLNILSQAKRYDPDGEYVKKWLPKLASLASAEH